MTEEIDDELYTYLGSSGLQISRLVVGCMSIGTKQFGEWVVSDKNQAFAILKRAYDRGIRTYDTANFYSNGASERLLGEFLKEYSIPRHSVVIFTKVFFPTEDNNPDFSSIKPVGKNPRSSVLVNRLGLSRKHILDSVEDSVKRLGTFIDLYQIHRFDPNTPIEETMKALHDVVESGKARYIGASSMRAYQFVMMQNVAEKNGWSKFISMQDYYNLNYREDEREMIPYCNLTGVGLIPYSPNDRGFLTRPFSAIIDDASRSKSLSHNLTDAEKEVITRVENVAKKHNVSMSAIALAWLLHKGANPIVGFSKPERVDDALTAIALKLSDSDIEFLEEAYVSKPLSFFFEQKKYH
ncbi:hypothetical protein PICMEDRAFT_72607 [Pichia membranifaciens NRRL Y-2026]|uniref:NADP-dependent oxidoreductase domain-containing protein n=1 Tax=Pichia membranifaciens NRRL Y-2026 TaxID=763406 RepID=A0A1E3NK82_9ASCO|nr:hypothetical protein PICMEDRAFT_72607 [Pichia membranifaciens NRRL Y-2026]ODQ46547.1 hypothetical protein PICMEDRAFT_72607 [Pichia membranifaciens NRRL Y-2026]